MRSSDFELQRLEEHRSGEGEHYSCPGWISVPLRRCNEHFTQESLRTQEKEDTASRCTVAVPKFPMLPEFEPCPILVSWEKFAQHLRMLPRWVLPAVCQLWVREKISPFVMQWLWESICLGGRDDVSSSVNVESMRCYLVQFQQSNEVFSNASVTSIFFGGCFEKVWSCIQSVGPGCMTACTDDFLCHHANVFGIRIANYTERPRVHAVPRQPIATRVNRVLYWHG